MNPEKLKKLQAQAAEVRIGGKGMPRRKKKVIHQSTGTDDKKLQLSLKKLGMNSIPGIEEVNMYKNDGTVIHFNHPRTQASLAANTFAISGHGESKSLAEMLQEYGKGPEGIQQLKHLASAFNASNRASLGALGLKKEGEAEGDDDDIPELVENFESKLETEATGASSSKEIVD